VCFLFLGCLVFVFVFFGFVLFVYYGGGGGGVCLCVFLDFEFFWVVPWSDYFGVIVFFWFFLNLGVLDVGCLSVIVKGWVG